MFSTNNLRLQSLIFIYSTGGRPRFFCVVGIIVMEDVGVFGLRIMRFILGMVELVRFNILVLAAGIIVEGKVVLVTR